MTGERVPDDSARLPCIAISTPARQIGRRQISSLAIRHLLAGQCAPRWAMAMEALRSAYLDVPDSADLVMFWWEKAANAVRRPQPPLWPDHHQQPETNL